MPSTVDCNENSLPLLEGIQRPIERHGTTTYQIRRKPLPPQSSISPLLGRLSYQAETSQSPTAAYVRLPRDHYRDSDDHVDGIQQESNFQDSASHSKKHPHGRSVACARWLPTTLRWPFLCSLVFSSAALVVIIINLQSRSLAREGLANNDGQSILFLAWRFMPTLVAVLYTLMHTMLLEDVKRTEPYARLAMPTGGSATATVLQEPGAWWNALIDGFSRKKNNRSWSWTLISSSLGLILCLMVISPLSSTLLVPVEVKTVSNTLFHGIQTQQRSPIDFGDQTVPRFRTIGNLLQNITTSVWITDRFTVLPFWPAVLDNAPLGASLGSSAQTWQAETTVYTCELNCEPLYLASLDWLTYGNDTIANGAPLPYNDTISSGVITLATDDGACTQMISMSNESNFVVFGGFSWNTPGNFTGGRFYHGSDENPIIFNVSQRCSGDEMILISTPWFTIPYNPTSNDCCGTWNSTLNLIGQSCTTSYRAAEIAVTVNITSSGSSINFSQEDYAIYGHPVEQAFLSTARFEELFLSADWAKHFVPVTSKPSFGGPGAPLAAMYDFSVFEATNDDKLIEQATKVKQRYFGEALIMSLSRDGALPVAIRNGTITSTQGRVVVAGIIAFALEAVLFIEAILVLTVFWTTRSRRRPLGLNCDPAQSLTIAKLIAGSGNTAREKFIVEGADHRQMKQALTGMRFRTASSHLHLAMSRKDDTDASESVVDEAERAQPIASRQETPDWKPAVLRKWTVFGLGTTLLAIMIVIAVLYGISAGPGLYQKAFLFQTQIEISNIHLSTIAPYSIVPTLVAVCIGIWWGAMETEFRQLQPFITMAQKPVRFADGVNLTYQSSYLVWAAIKAMFRNHWLLSLVCTGAFFSQILTVAMSALWQPNYDYKNQTTSLSRGLELRTVSYTTFTTDPQTQNSESLIRSSVLADLYGQLKTNWLYSSIIQISLGGSQPPWSSHGWSFVPVDLSPVGQTLRVRDKDDMAQMSSSNSTALYQANTLVKLTTQALSAQILCSPYEALSNSSNWLRFQDFSNSSVYNVTLNPPGLSSGYLFINPFVVIDNSSNTAYTTILSDEAEPQCCPNSTANSNGNAVIGYWSPNKYYESETGSSDSLNFTVKWIYGQPLLGVQNLEADRTHLEMAWRYPPRMAALNCMPVIQKANASIIVEQPTGSVESFMILDDPQIDEMAWSDDFVLQENTNVSTNDPNWGRVRVATSYGILFRAALLRAADQSNLDGWGSGFNPWETPTDSTFSFKEPGLNLDFMSYSMFSQLNWSTTALLDLDTLAKHANQTFSAFFQNYVSSNLSVTEGGWAYQKLGAKPLTAVGTKSNAQASPSPSSFTNPTVEVEVLTRVKMLRMSPAATWICMVILLWLLVTTVLISLVEKRYLGSLRQGVKSIADVARLVAASEALLTVIENSSDEETKAKTPSPMTRLGVFKDKKGHERYGIELVGDEHGVEWLDHFAEEYGERESQHREEGHSLTTRLPDAHSRVSQTQADRLPPRSRLI